MLTWSRPTRRPVHVHSLQCLILNSISSRACKLHSGVVECKLPVIIVVIIIIISSSSSVSSVVVSYSVDVWTVAASFSSSTSEPVAASVTALTSGTVAASLTVSTSGASVTTSASGTAAAVAGAGLFFAPHVHSRGARSFLALATISFSLALSASFHVSNGRVLSSTMSGSISRHRTSGVSFSVSRLSTVDDSSLWYSVRSRSCGSTGRFLAGGLMCSLRKSLTSFSSDTSDVLSLLCPTVSPAA